MNNSPANPFLGPMHPFSGLEHWARQLKLPQSGINLHLYDTGAETQTPILFLHGLGDEADTWRHVLPFITGYYRCLAPDLPGFGRSDKPDLKYTIPFFVSTMLELLDTLSISQAMIVGHSTGAMIAHQIALTHPERVKRLVLIGGSLVSKNQPINLGLLLFLMPGLGEWTYNRLRKNPQEAYQTLESYYYRLENLPQVDRDFLFQRVNERVWSDGQRKGFLSTLRNLAAWLPSQQKDLPRRLKGWTIPTDIIWGEMDRVNPVENAYALVELMPSAHLVIVPKAGHNLQQENGQIVVKIINGSPPKQTPGKDQSDIRSPKPPYQCISINRAMFRRQILLPS
jgi:pimeloyl-ACP methyl ester carboxylesterase